MYTAPGINIYSKNTQTELEPYLSEIIRMKPNSKKDTLYIGNFSNFKKQHPALLNTLLEGDSVRFYISDTQSKFDTIITLPIKY